MHSWNKYESNSAKVKEKIQFFPQEVKNETEGSGNSLDNTFPSGSKLEHSNHMFIFQFWKISKDFFVCHTGSQPAQNIADCNSCSDNTRFSKSDIRIIGNITSEISHNRTIGHFSESVNRKNTSHFRKKYFGPSPHTGDKNDHQEQRTEMVRICV